MDGAESLSVFSLGLDDRVAPPSLSCQRTGLLSKAAAAAAALVAPLSLMSSWLASYGSFFFFFHFFSQLDQQLSVIGGPSCQTRDTVLGLDNRLPLPPERKSLLALEGESR